MPSRGTLRSLWSKAISIYGIHWANRFGETPEHLSAGEFHQAGELTDTGATWREGLAGLTREQLALGLRRCVMSASGYPPTLPEFRALCLGVPSFEKVQLVLTNTKGQDEATAGFVRLVWRFLDAYRLARADKRDAAQMIRGAYELARTYRMELGDLPAPPVAAIGHEKYQKPTRASDETAERHRQRIAELLGLQDEAAGDAPAPTDTPQEMQA
ncbi:hypothetical protein [Dyella sp. 2RAB6]|uniref:hypothetical protein n=1 Tax=Dyella sp. 2RAB6 TaxID=3232992 RepID=UPI003F93E045